MTAKEQGTLLQESNATEKCEEKKTTFKDPGVKKRSGPDGGWGWMVVFGACIGQFTWGFIIKAFGVTYLILLDRYHASATSTIWIGAITIVCTLAIGPVAGSLCRQFGCRPVSMVGSAMVVTGVITTGLAPNIYVIYVTYAILAGIGLGFIYTPGFIIISQYFDKRKASAVSITAIANGGSTLIYPSLLLYLDREYGFSGMFLILGGVCLHLFIGASLYRPLNPKVKASKVPLASSNITRIKGIICCALQKKIPAKDKVDDVKADFHAAIPKGQKEKIKSKTVMERYSALFRNYAFLAFALVSMALSSVAGMISGVVPAIAVDNGIDETKAAFLVSISGICSVAGSLTFGRLYDMAAVRRFRCHVYTGCCVVKGGSVLLIGVVSAYPAYITLCVLAGICHGVVMPQRITIIGDIVSKTSDMEGFGVVTFMCAFGGLIGRGIAGPIKDSSGRYDMAFLISGGFTLVTALVFEVALIRHGRMQRKQQQPQIETEVVVTDKL